MASSLRIRTHKRSGPVPPAELPFLACEFKYANGEIIREDFSSLAKHVLMHPGDRIYYDLKLAMIHCDKDIFEILPQDHSALYRIYFKNKFATSAHDVPQYYLLEKRKIYTAFALGWQETCRQMRVYSSLFFDDV